MLLKDILRENVSVGKVVDVLKYNPASNRKEVVQVTIDEYKKSPGSDDKVSYTLKGGRRATVSVRVFKQMMKGAAK